jgi:hypothetical protein
VRTAETSPGYQQYCRHKHNIQRRGKDWGRCIEKYYYPYGSEPSRIGSFNDLQKKGCCPENPPKENLVNQSRQKGAIERIKQGMEYLLETVKVLPRKVGELKELLLGAIKEIFGIRTSDKTLARYKEFWHPRYIQPAALEVASQSATAVIELDHVVGQRGGVTENGQNQNRTLTKTKVGLELAEDTPVQAEGSDVEPVIEQKAELEINPPKDLLRENFSLCHTPPENALEIPEVDNPRKSLVQKGFRVCATPLCYMKVYVLNILGVGLISRNVFGRSLYPKIHSIEPGTHVRLCRGVRHSLHPQLVYVKPCTGAEDWLEGIAVSLSSLTLLNDS